MNPVFFADTNGTVRNIKSGLTPYYKVVRKSRFCFMTILIDVLHSQI